MTSSLLLILLFSVLDTKSFCSSNGLLLCGGAAATVCSGMFEEGVLVGFVVVRGNDPEAAAEAEAVAPAWTSVPSRRPTLLPLTLTLPPLLILLVRFLLVFLLLLLFLLKNFIFRSSVRGKSAMCVCVCGVCIFTVR